MLRTWWIAARPGSLVKVILPLGVGLSVGAARTGEVRPLYLGAAMLFGWFVQLLIIFLNDYADAEADILHTERFGELIDDRAIPHGWLQKRDLLAAGVGVLSLMILLSVSLAVWYSRPWAPVFAAGAIFLLWAYSFPPIRLNYRGLGEVLETIGVGGVLPWSGYYFYTGQLDLPLPAIGPLLLLALTSALTSGLKHMPADRVTGKRTAAVLLGTRSVRLVAVASVVLSIIYCAVMTVVSEYHVASVLLTVALPVWFLLSAVRHLGTADHLHLESLKLYKAMLHRAIYSTSLGLILSFLLQFQRPGGAA